MNERKEREYSHDVKASYSGQSRVACNEDSVTSWQVLVPAGGGSDAFLMRAPKTACIAR